MTKYEWRNFNKILAIANHQYSIKGTDMTLFVDDMRYTLRVWFTKKRPFVVVDKHWIYFQGVVSHPEIITEEEHDEDD